MKLPGPVEAAAWSDLDTIARLNRRITGNEVIELAYVLIAREVDRADVDADRYGKLTAARQLVSLRSDLAHDVDADSAGSLEEFWSEMSVRIAAG